MGDDEPMRTAEEQQVIEQIAESRGEEFTDKHEELILAQTRLVGEL